eukprot:COSAG02_NODE_1495_length_12314_cov_33.691691_12_plen_76_part_00
MKVIEVIEAKVASQGFCAAVSERVEAPNWELGTMGRSRHAVGTSRCEVREQGAWPMLPSRGGAWCGPQPLRLHPR